MIEKYRCDSCGEVFRDPYVYEMQEDMNGEGAWYTWRTELCPQCYSEAIYEYTEDEDD